MTYQPHQSEDLTTRPVARVGDRLCVKVQHPSPRTITMILATPESAAYANDLLADPSSGWKLAPGIPTPAALDAGNTGTDGGAAREAAQPMTDDEMVSVLDSAGIDIDPETAELIVRAVERWHEIGTPGMPGRDGGQQHG